MSVSRSTKMRITLEEYLSWPEERRAELISGRVYLLSAPSDAHQARLGNLAIQFGGYLKGKRCAARIAPYDVYLNADPQRPTIVQPDLSVICDPDKITQRGCLGAPDLIVEVLSPGTHQHDQLVKMNLYLRYGVREYWLLDPMERYLQTYVLEAGRYVRSGTYAQADEVPVGVLQDCRISLSEVFED